MDLKNRCYFAALNFVLACLVAMLYPSGAYAQDTEFRGFMENATYVRAHGVGLSKSRNTLQLELSRAFRPTGIFTDVSINATFRGTYDAVYDLNDGEFGDSSGRAVSFPAPGNPAFFGILATGNPATPPFPPSTNPVFAGIFPPPVASGAIPLPGVPGGNIGTGNPNEGLGLVGEDAHDFSDGGVVLAYPTRPCDVDNRGCIEGYMNASENDLKFPEFNSRLDFIRELYLDATMVFKNGNELGFKIGRQQVVWGRTDLFRVLDVINPVDFSRQNIFDELEDIRIPMGIFNVEYRAGAIGPFEDLNFQAIWKFEGFRPNNLGQGGQPYAILGAGNFFRAMNNCWDNGCTVWNFPTTGLAVEFPSHTLGIRQANVPDFNDAQDFGFRVEGVASGIGFSLNFLRYTSQMPSLRGGIPSDNPFTPTPEAQFHPYSLAFDIAFPRLTMIGASADFYSEAIKTAFRAEVSHTSGEEFPNSLRERMFSKSDVIRWVVGIDRPTFIPFLNKHRAFLLSFQIFGQHLLDHEKRRVNAQGIPTLGAVGMVDWKNNYVTTFLFQGNYLNDRVTPQILSAYDFGAGSGVVAPSIDWKISNNWRLTAAVNVKFGDGPKKFDDNRAANPYPPFTCAPPLVAAGSPLCGAPYSSLGVGGFEPLGRFRAGPFGMAINEDEYQLTLRYRF